MNPGEVKLTPEAIEGFARALLIKHFDTPSATPEFHKELWELCCSDNPLVAIAAPRGHGKSTAINFIYLLAEVLFRRSKFVVLVSDTEGQAQYFLEQIKTTLETNTDLRDLFGFKGFDLYTKTDIIVRMDDGHRFRIIAKGSEQRVRGLLWDFYRPDLIIGDDLENDEIVLNDDRRKKFKEWMINALLPTRGPRGRVRIVGTILHMDSFLANVVPLEGDRDTVEDESGLRFTSRNKLLMFKGVLYKAHVGGHPSEIKKPSDTIWPERFDKKWYIEKHLIAAQAGLPEGYSQEYLNRPLDESQAFFRKSDLKSMTPEEQDQIARQTRPLLFYCGVDLAITEKERADYSAFVVVGIDHDGMMYVMDSIRERMDARTIIATCLKLQKDWNLQWMAIESEKTSKTLLPFLKEEMMRSGEFINIIPIIPHLDKTARAASIQGRMRIGAVKIDKKGDFYPVFESEFLQFPRGKHDDQVDAFSCIGLALQKLSRADTYAEEREREIREQEEETLSVYDGRSASTGY